MFPFSPFTVLEEFDFLSIQIGEGFICPMYAREGVPIQKKIPYPGR
jgi:hypothetical protein